MRTLTGFCAVLVAAALTGGCASGGGGASTGGGGAGGGPQNIFAAMLCAVLCPLGPALAAINVRTQMDYRTDNGPLSPQAYPGQPDGPYLAGEVQVRYDEAGKLVFFEPGGFNATGSVPVRYASLQAAGLPWLEAGGNRVKGAAPSPFTTGADAQVALVANPRSLGWDYQSFGVWNTAHAGGGAMHASSFGTATPGASVPTSGSATFSGKLAGFYVSASGEGAVAAADLNVRADFHARSLAFSSTKTVTTRDLKAPVAAPGLNLSGTLTYQPGSNAFSGTLRNAAGTMSGGTSGKFHGPAAQELGGVFNLRSTGTSEAFTGAYGAKR